jgi:hypothetical protein
MSPIRFSAAWRSSAGFESREVALEVSLQVALEIALRGLERLLQRLKGLRLKAQQKWHQTAEQPNELLNVRRLRCGRRRTGN